MPPYVRRHAAVRLRGLVSTGIIPAFAHGVETERRFQNCPRSGNNPLGRVVAIPTSVEDGSCSRYFEHRIGYFSVPNGGDNRTTISAPLRLGTATVDGYCFDRWSRVCHLGVQSLRQANRKRTDRSDAEGSLKLYTILYREIVRPAKAANTATREINKLRRLNTGQAFESHPHREETTCSDSVQHRGLNGPATAAVIASFRWLENLPTQKGIFGA